MEPKDKYNDDLEYLAQQGFETVRVSDSDLEGLKKKIRKRSFSFKNSIYFGFTSLVIGVCIGGSVFYIIFKKPLDHKTIKMENKTENLISQPGNIGNPAISLGTIPVVKENFINPSSKKEKSFSTPEINSVPKMDSADVIPSKPLDLSSLSSPAIKEEKLKYMINSPVFYLHDLKITNYTTLYFKKNRFVKYTGLSPDYSNKEEALARPGLKQSADYYLHDEIANAMLYFKKAKYDQAINSLKVVATYNEEDLNCSFYLAMCYYYKKNYAKALEYFDVCINNVNNTFLQEAMYYKALSLYESGSKEEAKLLLRKIESGNEFYSEKAKNYLRD